ncbi:protein of unknown function [Magnetospira sp. QH-2]|nr:protein of unknown function [Magnetospira sp. QH-2]
MTAVGHRPGTPMTPVGGLFPPPHYSLGNFGAGQPAVAGPEANPMPKVARGGASLQRIPTPWARHVPHRTGQCF